MIQSPKLQQTPFVHVQANHLNKWMEKYKASLSATETGKMNDKTCSTKW